jgi:hypothetical protein
VFDSLLGEHEAGGRVAMSVEGDEALAKDSVPAAIGSSTRRAAANRLIE